MQKCIQKLQKSGRIIPNHIPIRSYSRLVYIPNRSALDQYGFQLGVILISIGSNQERSQLVCIPIRSSSELVWMLIESNRQSEGTISLQHFKEQDFLMINEIKRRFNTNFKHCKRTCLEHWSQFRHAQPILRKIWHVSIINRSLKMINPMMSNVAFSKLAYQKNKVWDIARTKTPKCNKHRKIIANGFLDWPRKVLHLLSFPSRRQRQYFTIFPWPIPKPFGKYSLIEILQAFHAVGIQLLTQCLIMQLLDFVQYLIHTQFLTQRGFGVLLEPQICYMHGQERTNKFKM